ncbi:MAG: CPBP family intramembrane metalloprotease [Oscillospiraceae bacterium]|nr:CPBP family intramembrane metalloprotease [Oscillospiraceae bacterium]
MERKRRSFPEFTSALSRTETIQVLAWLPMHLLLLPWAFSVLSDRGMLTPVWANVLYYGLGFGYMLSAAFRFLRRDFDPLYDRPFFVAGQVAYGYLGMLLFNILIGMLISDLTALENANNAGLHSLVDVSYGPMKAALVYLAPLTEEMLFRAGLFGTLRKKNRLLAYAVSMLAFSLYHVWNYAAADPAYWIYLLQYLPAGWLLARCYERTNSIWGSVFFHMLTNALALELYRAVLQTM